MKAKLLIVVLCTAAVGLLCQARAGLVLSNLDQPWIGNTYVGLGDWYATSFTTGPGSGVWNLEYIRQRMWIAPGEVWALDLYGGQVDYVGDYIGRLLQQGAGGRDGPVYESNPSLYAYLFGSYDSYLLQPNSTYWLVTKPMQATTGVLQWVNEVQYQVQSPGWSFGPMGLYSDNEGRSWSPLSQWQRTELNLGLVPEPQTMAMLAGLGLLGFALLRRRLA